MQMRPTRLYMAVLLLLPLSQVACNRAPPKIGGPTAAGAGSAIPTATAVPWLPLPRFGNTIPEQLDRIDVGPTGAAWIVSRETLVRVSSHGKREFSSQQTLVKTPILMVASLPTGLVYATQKGLYWIDDQDDRARDRVLFEGMFPSAIWQDDRLYYLRSSPEHVITLETMHLDRDGVPDVPNRSTMKSVSLRQILPGGRNWLLAQTPDRKWHRLETATFRVTPLPAGLDAEYRKSLHHEEGVFLFSDQGVYWLPDKEASRTTPIWTEKPSEIRDIALSPDHKRLWVIREHEVLGWSVDAARIISRFPLPKKHWHYEEAYYYDSYTLHYDAIAEDNNGLLFIGSTHGGLIGAPFDSQPLTPITAAAGFDASSDPPKSFGFTTDGKLWIGGKDRLVITDHQTGARPLKQQTTPGPVLDAFVGAMTLLTTEQGLFKQDASGWTMVPSLLTTSSRASPSETGIWGLYSLMEDAASHNVNYTALLSSVQLATLKQWSLSDGMFRAALRTSFSKGERLIPPVAAYRFMGESVPGVVVGGFPIPDLGGEFHLIGAPHEGGTVSLHTLHSASDFAFRGVVQEPASGSWLTLRFNRIRRASPALDEIDSLKSPDRKIEDHVVYQQSNASTVFGEKSQTDQEEDLRSLIAPSSGNGHILLRGDFRLWKRKEPDDWETLLQTQRLDPRRAILGLLVEADGQSLLVGCRQCGEHNLFHIAPDGKIEDLPLAGEKVGCGDNALLRDSTGRTFVSTLQGLYMRPRDSAPFAPVLQENGKRFSVHSNSMLEDSQGRIWLAAGHTSDITEVTLGDLADDASELAPGSLWMIEPKHPPRQIKPFPGRITSLARTFDGKTGSERLWVGGDKLLKSFAIGGKEGDERPLAEERTIEISQSNRGGLHDVRLASDGTEVLAWTSGGAYTCATGCKLIDLPEKANFGRNSELGTAVRAYPDGTAILALGQQDRSSRIWVRAGHDKKFDYLGQTELVHTIARDRKGRVLLGGEGGRIYELGPTEMLEPRFDLFPPNPAHAEVTGPLKSICPLLDGSILVRAWDPHLILLSPQGERRQLRAAVRSFQSCVALDAQRVMLRHLDGATLLTRQGQEYVAESVDFIDEKSQRVKGKDLDALVAASVTGSPTDAQRIFAAYDNKVWVLDAKAGHFVPRVSLPASFRNVTQRLTSVGPWLWLWGSGDAVAVLDTTAPESKWQLYDKLDGQPAEFVYNIVPVGPLEVRIFGWSVAASAKWQDAAWRFAQIRDLELSIVKHNDATTFLLDGKPVIALATSRGCSLREIIPGEKDLERLPELAVIDGAHQLDSDNVTHVRFAKDRNRLFVTTYAEVAAYDLRWDHGHIAATQVATVRRGFDSEFNASLLPEERIYDIQVSTSGRDAWLLAQTPKFRLGGRETYIIRWNVEQRRVTYSRLPLFAEPYLTRLGPSINEKPPQFLLYHPLSGWSLWNLGSLFNPQLQVRDRFLWHSAELTAGSLDPALEDLKGWDVRYMNDHQLAAAARGSAFLPPDLIFPRERYQRIAVLERQVGNRWVRIVAASPIRELSSDVWLLRLLLLLSVSGGLLALLVQRIVRRIVRARMLQAQVIPYVQGEAIQDPTKFFGREALMVKLRDTIETTNYALIGEFRIGKTSIQRQMSLLMRSMVHQTHVFIPIFVDLQHLGLAGKDTFFAFLAQHMFEECKQQGLGDEVMAKSEWSSFSATPEDYDSFTLQGDISLVLSALERLHPERKPVLVFQIDEIALMERFSDDTRLGLRAIFVNQPQAKVILSGPRLARNPELDQLSPWWNFLKVEEIEPLTPSEGRALITRPVRGLFHFTEEAIEHTIARSEGRPLKLQMICADVLRYKYAMRSLRRRITLADIRAALAYAEEQSRRQAAANKEAA